MSEQRFIDLEIKISHQEYLLETLNQVVSEQQKAIDVLETKMTYLAKRLGGATDDEIGPAGEKPPHY